MSAPSNNKIWDGYLRLNSSLTLPIVASFKSGEKMPNVKWTDTIEVKGKVKLHDFETYIQDLTRSPNRRLTVVSLYWKEGNSKLEFKGMKKVVRKYVEDGRVGLAKVKTGIDLYVCPCSDTIITLLEKYGFFKLNDKTSIDESKDYLIGCVVWKKSQIIHSSYVHQKSSQSSRSGNTSPIQIWSSIREQSRKNNPIEIWSPIRTPIKSQQKNEPYKKTYFNDIVKSEDTPNVLPSVSISTELETSDPCLIVKPTVRPDLTVVTKPSSPTCDKKIHKKNMEEDMEISPQKKVCCRYDNENMSNVKIIHSAEQSFIPPLPVVQVHQPFAKQKPGFTYLGPVLMREQQLHSHAKPNFTYLGPSFMREQTNAHVHAKPGFTYLGAEFTREQTHAQVHTKPRRSDVCMTFSRDHAINCSRHFNFSSNLLPPQWNASNQPYQS